MKGVVKWFDATRGFGFIYAEGITHKGDDYKGDVFVHASELSEDNKVLLDGQHVEFDTDYGYKGLKAKNVRVFVPE